MVQAPGRSHRFSFQTLNRVRSGLAGDRSAAE
jgi:hypothetical protein